MSNFTYHRNAFLIPSCPLQPPSPEKTGSTSYHTDQEVDILLSAVMLLTALILPGTAATLYPESDHNYKNNTDQTWEYVHPDHPERLFVTFSERTSFAASWVGYSYLEEGDLTEEALQELAETGWYFPEEDDRLYIYDNTGALYGSYTGSELSGVTLLLPGDRFTLHLVTDGTGAVYDLYPVYTPIGMRAEEVYSFTNSDQ